MDERAFSEVSLKELFAVLSDAFPEPKTLSVTVYTSPGAGQAARPKRRFGGARSPERRQTPLCWLSSDG
jgi:hypothetical protein